jgi:hypothetical protein
MRETLKAPGSGGPRRREVGPGGQWTQAESRLAAGLDPWQGRGQGAATTRHTRERAARRRGSMTRQLVGERGRGGEQDRDGTRTGTWVR